MNITDASVLGGGVCERSLPFCSGIQFSGDSIHMINDRIKKRAGSSLLKVYSNETIQKHSRFFGFL